MQTIDAMSRFEFIQEGYNERDVKEISENIVENGWIDDACYPVVLVKCEKKYIVIDGNHRINAAKLALECGWIGKISAVVTDKSTFDEIIERFDGDVENNLFDIAEIIRGLD